jgi:PTS system nitrogen regulatory IIA component
MQLSDILLPRHVLPDVRVADKSALLSELSRNAGTTLGIPPEAIASALVKREALGSTGMGGGIAIPHARLAGVTKPFGLLARLDQGIDFDAVDGERVDIVFLLLLPEASDADINALACVARKLRDPQVLAAVRRAKDARGIFARITAEAAQTT